MRNFKNLMVWLKSMTLAEEMYKLTQLFPSEEKFGLITQLRRASVSIASNIAEGCATSTVAHFKKFLENAIGSAFEIETQLLIAARVYVDLKENIEKILPVINEVQKMLNSLIEKLKLDSHKWLSANG